MTLRAALALGFLLVVALLAPLAVAADTCEECTGGPHAGCCPPACGACLCCGQSASLAGERPLAAPQAVAEQAVWQRPVARCAAPAPRAVFHVPKPLP